MELDALPLGPLPPPRNESRVGLRDVSRLGEEQCERVLRRRQDVRLRCVHNHDTEARRRGSVDVVETDPGTSDYEQLLAGLEDLCGHVGRRADHECICSLDCFDQLFRRQVQADVDLMPSIPHELESSVGELLCNQNNGHLQTAVAKSSPSRRTPSARSSSESAYERRK